MKWMRLTVGVLLVLLLAACSSGKVDLVGEWMGTESAGGGGKVTFNDNDTVLVEMGLFNNSFEWEVEDDILKLYTTKNGEQQLAYQYEIEQESKENITLYELDSEGKRVDGSLIKLSK
ncbi:hypothetical protein [Metasolibacillus meyeri]|uniref:hypothetical protein n=1 Tax=Metasolibacillus meyeri TaxID=1071052 RepID=UPI000D322A4F|nr:hypothetical protein [Metasolibacillus meyeri]